MYYIYVITCALNDKKYVGKTNIILKKNESTPRKFYKLRP